MWGGCHLGRLGPPPHPSLECFLHHRFEIVVSSKQYHSFWLFVIRSYLAEIISKTLSIRVSFVLLWGDGEEKTAQSKGLTCIVAPAPSTCVIQHGILNQLTDCLTAWLDSLLWSLEWCPNFFMQNTKMVTQQTETVNREIFGAQSVKIPMLQVFLH